MRRRQSFLHYHISVLTKQPDHIPSLLTTQHWFSITLKIKSKLLNVAYRVLYDLALTSPSNLLPLLPLLSPVPAATPEPPFPSFHPSWRTCFPLLCVLVLAVLPDREMHNDCLLLITEASSHVLTYQWSLPWPLLARMLFASQYSFYLSSLVKHFGIQPNSYINQVLCN